MTGNKRQAKIYYRHSGYPGGLRSRTLAEQLDRRPTEVIREAVKGMLPRNRLARQQLTKLKVYAGPEHPHEAQNPQPLPESMSQIAQYRGTGKRKTSVARVILRPGDGSTWINGRTIEEYFPRAGPAGARDRAAPGRRRRGQVRPPGAAPRRRADRPGRRAAPRHRQGSGRGRSRASHRSQARGLPDARRTRRRAQEGRPAQGAQGAAVLQALDLATSILRDRRGPGGRRRRADRPTSSSASVRRSARWSGGESVLVGRDTRASGPALERALVGGPRRGGLARRCSAASSRLPPSPCSRDDSGAVVSASHNPPRVQRREVLSRGGWKLEDDEEEAIEALLDGAGDARGEAPTPLVASRVRSRTAT